MVRLVERDDPT